jgi:S-adenosylmethionine uptake transporter
MLFYSALITTLLSLPPALADWHNPNITELALLLLLGMSANLILFFLLKAFSLVDATAVAPYRYFELAISATMAFFVFGEIPHTDTLYGAAILIPTTLFIAWSETKINKKARGNE